MPFAIDRPTRTAKWLAGSTFLRSAQTSKAYHAVAGIWICKTASSLLVNWRVLALMLSHPRKLRALPSVPVTHSRSVKPRSLQTRSTSSREYCRRKMRLPVPFRNEVDGNLVADHARRDRRHVSARGVRCRKEAVLLPGIERWAVLPTEHFSHNEDEYCSAKATAQEQIQQGIACCG